VLWRVMLPDARTHAGVRSSQMVSAQLAGLPRFLRQPQMIALYLATLSLMFTFVGITTLVQLAGPGSAHNPSVMQGVRVATLPALAIVPLAAAVLTKIPRPRRLGGAMILVSLAAAASGLAAGPLTLALALAMLTIAVAATAPALVETITQASPPDQRGGATALYGFALFVGASLAAPAATFASHMSYPSAAIGFAAIAALGTLCATLPTRATRTKPDALREPSE
jgi:predicted MFS family arabinose efflux permease